MKRKILVDASDRKFLEAAFGVTSVMIWKALTFESDTDLAKRIRKLAMARGGKVVMTIPEVETIHTHDGQMKQTFPNGAAIHIEMSTGLCRLFFKDKQIDETIITGISELAAFQQRASEIK